MAKDFPESFRDPLYASLDAATEQRLGLPTGLLSGIRLNGERSNANQVSSASAVTPYQVIPATRDALIKKYGVDPTASPEAASQAAGLLLREGLDRNKGDTSAAIGEYIGGTDRKNWGPQTRAYINRVSVGLRNQEVQKADEIGKGFDDWLQANPSIPATPAPSTPAKSAPLPDDLTKGFDDWIAKAGPQAGMQPSPTKTAGAPNPNEEGLVDKLLIGPGETALSLATGATSGMLGGLLAGGNRIAQQVGGMLQGKTADEIKAEGPSAEDAMTQGMQALTYSPRSAAGQRMTESVGQAMQEHGGSVVGIGPEIAALGKAMSAGRGAAPASVLARAGAEGVTRDIAGDAAAAGVGKAIDAVPKAAQAVTTLPRRAMEALGKKPAAPTAGTMGSAGAAGTDMAAQRVATAEGLGFAGDTGLTTGQATREPAQLKFEVETAKAPSEGAPLRERMAAQNERALQFFDEAIDKTGAEAPTLRAIGQSVDKALLEQYKRDKTQVRVAYAEAAKSPESRALVDVASPVSIGEAESAITGTPLSFLNEQPRGLPNTGLADAARQYATRLGIATEADGQLIPMPSVTIRQMEDWRKAINAATGYDPVDIRTSTILKAMIDGQTEPVAGPIYRQARATRQRLAQNYEDRAVINKLVTTKRGSADRQVAYEDVLDHTMLNGSLDDVRNVRRVLQRGGQDGQQAWKELQGGTVGWIRDQATKNVATDAAGNRVLSPAALDKAIRSLDQDGRLDFIFGKQGAQQLRDINEVAKVIRTVPPEAAINTSNTAATLLSAFADLGISHAAGIPAPIATGWKMARGYIKDRALRKRVDASLNRRQP